MNGPRKIKAVAIAKDEAAYLHEWVFHHLYFGFDGVEIILNRTTDNSISVLEGLARQFENFSYSSCDWIDLCAPAINIKMQEVAYAQACSKALDEGYSHVLLIDVDEFWTPIDFKTSIHEFLDCIGVDGSVSFNWVCELGQHSPFQPLSTELRYFLSTHLKTLSRVSDLKEVRIHTPVLGEGATHYMADGQAFIPKKNAPQFCDLNIDSLLKAFVVHRLYRSEVEYLAVLVRGNPDSKTRGPADFKLNRHGYNFNQGPSAVASFPIHEVAKYHAGLEAILKSEDLFTGISIARETVLDRYRECLKLAVSIEYSNNRLVQQLFHGCTVEPLARMFTEPRKTDYSLDVVRADNGVLIISGWAFSKWARSELRFGVQGANKLDGLSWRRSERPDVSRVKPWIPVNSGFDFRLMGYPHSAMTAPNDFITFEIFEADLIEVYHGSYLFYDMEQYSIRHGRTQDLRMKSWLIPIYLSGDSGQEALSVLINHKTFTLLHTGGKVKAVEVVNSAERNFMFVKHPHAGELFSIKHGALFAGAAPGGDFYFNRSIVQDWETFKLAPNAIEAKTTVKAIVARTA